MSRRPRFQPRQSNVSASGVSPTSGSSPGPNNSNGATGFTVQRSGDGGKSWTSVTPPDGNTTDIMDLGVQESSTYIYQIVALDAGGPSSPAVTAVPITTVPLRPPISSPPPPVQPAWS